MGVETLFGIHSEIGENAEEGLISNFLPSSGKFQGLKSFNLFYFSISLYPDFDQTTFLNDIFRFRARYVETRFYSGFID